MARQAGTKGVWMLKKQVGQTRRDNQSGQAKPRKAPVGASECGRAMKVLAGSSCFQAPAKRETPPPFRTQLLRFTRASHTGTRAQKNVFTQQSAHGMENRNPAVRAEPRDMRAHMRMPCEYTSTTSHANGPMKSARAYARCLVGVVFSASCDPVVHCTC